MFLIIINQILKMLLIMILGCICYRLKMVDQKGNKMLANLLLMVVNPCVAIMALQVDYDPTMAAGLAVTFLAALLTHLAMIAITFLCFRSTDNPDCGIDRFSSMYANCGFIGIPLIQSILGNEGVFYLTAYIIAFNLFSWTHGIMIMSGKTSFKDLKKGLLSPMLVACVTAIALFVLQIRLPAVVGDAINYICGMNTPLAMLIAGISVAQTSLPHILKFRKFYMVTAIKLLLMPALVLAVFSFVQINTTIMYTVLVASACPSAASCTAFALRFHKNDRYASELYAFSTICSLVTIPMFVYAAERLFV